MLGGTLADATTRTLSRSKRLGIYRDAYFLRLHELLSATYSALRKILGDASFDMLVAGYTALHRSHHFSIRHYGDALAKFLATDARFARTPALAEVAAWEWAMAHAFDAADSVPIDGAALARVPPQSWASVTFRLHDSLKPMAARWNSVAMWQAANRDEPLPEAARLPRACTRVVWRRGLNVVFEHLDGNERDALRRALKGQTFAGICACAPKTLGAAEQAAWAVQLIQRWVVRGWITGLVIP